MNLALRPYVTTGIAIVGASVIAVAPITLPPPKIAAVEVAAVDAVRTATTDVELTAIVDALIAAFPEAAARIVQFVSQDLPNAVLSEVAAGHFAHLIPIAVAVALGWPTVPLGAFIDAFETGLPLPLGTFDGAVVQAYFLANALTALVPNLLTEVARVIDGVSAPGDLPGNLIAVFTNTISIALGNVKSIIEAFAGATPFSGLATPMSAANAGQMALPVDFGSLLGALVGAIPVSVAESVKLFAETIPNAAQGLITMGKFAHLPVLAANAVAFGVLTPVAPFLIALIEELPLPIGTPDGLINETWKLAIHTPTVTGLTVLGLLAQVIDDGLSPADALSGALDTLSNAIGSTVESIGRIVAVVTNALPSGATAVVPELDGARTMTMGADTPTLDDANVVPSSVNSSAQQEAIDTVTVTVDSSASADGTETGDAPSTTAGSDDESDPELESEDKSPDSADDDVTSNGATDLSDGNMAEPGSTGEQSSGEDTDGSGSGTETETTSAGDDSTTTTTDADTQSGHSSGDGSENAGSAE